MQERLGNTLYVDLSSGSVTVTGTDESVARRYLGGRGLGVKILSELTNQDTDPLSPQNPLIFSVGPLTGIAPLAAGVVLTSKSPLTGTVFSWNTGGSFGNEMKKVGIDALVITGKAKSPVYVELKTGTVRIKPAGELWGKNIEECTAALQGKESLRERGSVACIGRAGEKKVLISSFVFDSEFIGRGGLGAVAGSKLLKAVLVKGDSVLEPANPELFTELEAKALKLFDANPVLSKGLEKYGRAGFVKILDYFSLIPCQNFSKRGQVVTDQLSGEYITSNFALEKESCPNCPLGCRQRIKETGEFVPSYDALWGFGLNLENPNFFSVLKANRICIDYGLDPISAGSVLGALAELEARKLQPQEIESRLLEIGEGEKAGNGARRYLSALGRSKLSMDVKGLELAGFDPRETKGQALAYAVSPHGGDFMTALMVGPEVLGKPLALNRMSLIGKAGFLQVFENLSAVLDSLVLCPVSIFALNEEFCSSLLFAATGLKVSPAALLKVGERTWNLERIYNLKAGFNIKDDTLPERLFENKTGKHKKGISKQEFKLALLEYYHFRGWDENGVPSPEKLQDLKM